MFSRNLPERLWLGCAACRQQKNAAANHQIPEWSVESMMHQITELEQALEVVRKLEEEKIHLIACAEELEFEASHNYHTLTKKVAELKAENAELKEKFEFSDSHYHMTQRHANNLQAMLDGSNAELARVRDRVSELQAMVDIKNTEQAQARSNIEKLHQELNYRSAEVLQLRVELEKMQTLADMRADECTQTRRHADNLQSMLDATQEEFLNTRIHADNLQRMLNAGAGGRRSLLRRIKDKVKG